MVSQGKAEEGARKSGSGWFLWAALEHPDHFSRPLDAIHQKGRGIDCLQCKGGGRDQEMRLFPGKEVCVLWPVALTVTSTELSVVPMLRLPVGVGTARLRAGGGGGQSWGIITGCLSHPGYSAGQRLTHSRISVNIC